MNRITYKFTLGLTLVLMLAISTLGHSALKRNEVSVSSQGFKTANKSQVVFKSPKKQPNPVNLEIPKGLDSQDEPIKAWAKDWNLDIAKPEKFPIEVRTPYDCNNNGTLDEIEKSVGAIGLEQKLVSTGDYPVYPAIGDFNQDLNLDILLPWAGGGGVSLVYLDANNNVISNFQGQFAGTNDQIWNAEAAQFNDDNGDGIIDERDYLDFAVADWDRGGLYYFLNNLSQTYEPGEVFDIFATEIDPTQYPQEATQERQTSNDIEIADINLDGLPDIIANTFLGGSDANRFSVFLNTGNVGEGQFDGTSYILHHDLNCSTWDVEAKDVNNDLYPDVIYACPKLNNVYIFLNTGAEPFFDSQEQTTVDVGDSTYCCAENLRRINEASVMTIEVTTPKVLALEDVNRDDLQDLFISEFTNDGSFYLSLNNGGGNFASPVLIHSGGLSYAYGLDTGDFDADGDIDVAIASYGEGRVDVLSKLDDQNLFTYAQLENFQLLNSDGEGSNYKGNWGLRVADLNKDGRSDIVTGDYKRHTASYFLSNPVPAVDQDGDGQIDSCEDNIMLKRPNF